MAMDFAITDRQLDGDTHVVAVSGEIDLFTAPEFKQQLLGMIESGHPLIALDLSDVDFLDSSGLGAIHAPTTILLTSGHPARRLGAAWQPPPCMIAEIMFTGAAALMRSSTAIRKNVCVPPPDAPVTPMRFGSTSDSDEMKSTDRMLFQSWMPMGPTLHRS